MSKMSNEPDSKVCTVSQCNVMKDLFSNSEYHKNSSQRKCTDCIARKALNQVCFPHVNECITMSKEYSDLQMSVFGHSDTIRADEWHTKCRDASVDAKKLHQLSALKLRLLAQHYQSVVQHLPEVQQHKGEWLYLVDCSEDYPDSSFTSYKSNEDAFDAGCDRCVLPPVVFTIQVGACDERSKRSGVIVTDDITMVLENEILLISEPSCHLKDVCSGIGSGMFKQISNFNPFGIETVN
jgi:hypothetical protein